MRSVLPSWVVTLFIVPLSLGLIDKDVVQRFLTVPDISPPKLEVSFSDPSSIASRYIFLSPWYTTKTDTGPHIYDNQGQLVWSGSQFVSGSFVSNFHVCDFHSKPSLCFFQGKRREGWGQGHAVVLDQNYRTIHRIDGESSEKMVDMHEFKLLNGGKTGITTAYSIEPFDGTAVSLSDGTSWLLNNHFREIDVTSGDVIFSWNAMDHFKPKKQLPGLSYPGTSRLKPLDFFHLNSVTKSADGDYIISARHTSAVYKISHEDGHIVWTFGGDDSDFVADFSLCQQHHAQILEEETSKMVISVFDNSCKQQPEPASSAKIIQLDLLNMTATVLREYGSQADVAVFSQGSTMVLPESENVMAGWGSRSMITEYTKDGRLVFNATLSGMAYTYRAYKFEWHGAPLENPAVFSYARNTTAQTVLYVSWNGATEVSRWRFFGGISASTASELLGETERTGFETMMVADRYVDFVYAEALARDGRSLGRSNVEATFVPSVDLAKSCTELMCPWESKRTEASADQLYGSLHQVVVDVVSVVRSRAYWCTVAVFLLLYVYARRRHRRLMPTRGRPRSRVVVSTC